MEKFALQDAEYRAATFEMLVELTAQHVTLKELVLRNMAGGNENKMEILAKEHDQLLEERMNNLFDRIYAHYGNLPEEIKALLKSRK